MADRLRAAAAAETARLGRCHAFQRQVREGLLRVLRPDDAEILKTACTSALLEMVRRGTWDLGRAWEVWSDVNDMRWLLCALKHDDDYQDERTPERLRTLIPHFNNLLENARHDARRRIKRRERAHMLRAARAAAGRRRKRT